MLKDLLNQKMTTKEFQEEFKDFHSHDIAISLMTLDESERKKLYSYLTNEQIAEIVSYLDPSDAILVLEEFDTNKKSAILNEMTVDDVVDILQEYDDETKRDNIIKTLSESEDILEFIQYKENKVGAYMNNEFIVIHPDMDVKEAVTSLINQATDVETINTLFVVDENYQYIGAVNLKRLVKARSPKLIKEIMVQVPTVTDNTLISEAVFDMKNYEVFELPVLDLDNNLIGILTLDDVLDVAIEEAHEDFKQFSALPISDVERGTLSTAIHRLPWLTILMVLSIPLISFTDIMTSATAGIAILVFFQPLLLDSPGNVSTQTLAIALKSISNEGKMKSKDILSELSSGLITGFILGIIAFIVSFIFILITKVSPDVQLTFNDYQISLIFATILGASLMIVVTLSPLISIGIPHFLKLLKLDPAVASGPFITTIIDFISALVYFGLATLILQGVGII